MTGPLPIVLLLAIAAAPPGPVQDDPLVEAHLRNVFLERREAFEAAWEAAGDGARRRVIDAFEERRALGLPGLHQTSAELLTELRCVLAGEVEDVAEISPARRLAQSLDLRVIPGAFAATREPRGGEVIVRVAPVYTRLVRTALPEEVQLTLLWIAPDGRELRARSEPVHRDAFALPGFEMYFHAPPSEPGLWHLVPEVRDGDDVGRGVPVPVECVADLFPRFDRLCATEPRDAAEARWRGALERWVRSGTRDGTVPPVGRMLAGDLDGLAPPPVEAPWGGGASHLFEPSGPRDGEEPRGLVVVVRPALEEAAWSVVGRRGLAWRRLAVEARSAVLVTSLPVSDPVGPDVLELLEEQRARVSGPITVVVSGSGLGRLRLGLAHGGGELDFDRLVVDAALPRPPHRPLPVPTLVHAPLLTDGGLARIGLDDPPLHWLERASPPVIAELELPRWIGEWLDLLQ